MRRLKIRKFENWEFPMIYRAGFTLFELLVVVSIIGILIGFGTVAFSSAQKRARDARRKQDMDGVQVAMEQCYGLLDGSYPASCYSSGDSVTCDSTVVMDKFPTDPKNSGSYVYSSSSCDADEYCYCAYLETTDGNYGAADCSTSGGTYYCVSERQ
jgi:prepilin-type N-terminal cleavage/methylation domain-containing protein